ncbi:MAG: VOC family protein [Lachnospiraceae bacterium]|nr:VOC family protein [Lachnospiraceae bacterium]
MILRHVSVFTARFEESINFYSEIVGLHILKDLRGFSDHEIVFMGYEEGGTMVELIGCEEHMAYNGSGINLGFVVDDAESFREELFGEGYEVSPIISPNPHTKFFIVQDPNGLNVQFISEE